MNPRSDRWLLTLALAALLPLAAVAQSADPGGNVNIDLNGPGGGVHVDVHDQGDAASAGVHVQAGAHQDVRVNRPGEAYRLTFDTDARGRTLFKILAPAGLRARVTQGRRLVAEDTIPLRFVASPGRAYRIRVFGPEGKIFDETLRARRGQLARLWVRDGAAGGQVSVHAGGPGSGQVAVNVGGQVRVDAAGGGSAGGVTVAVGAGAPPPPAPAPPPPAPMPAPVAAPPPPAPAPASPCMSDADLGSLEQALGAEDFSDGKLTVLGDFAQGHAFCVSQVVTVLGKLDFSDGKLKALQIMKPHIMDPENNFRIYQAFDFDADKAKARAILNQ